MTALPQTQATTETPTLQDIVSRYGLPALLALALDRLLPHNRDKSPPEMIIEAREHLAAWLSAFENGEIDAHAAPENALEWMEPWCILDHYEFENDFLRDAAELILESAVFSPNEGDEGDQIAEAISILEEAIKEEAEAHG